MHTVGRILKIIGIDEAGRGPLAGPVVAAAVMIRSNIEGIEDSKRLSSKKRETLFPLIKEKSIAFGVGIASHKEIDRLNILQASLLSMKRAVKSLEYCYANRNGYPLKNAMLLIDGPFVIPHFSYPQKAIVRGDSKVYEISAASIIAKVTRDKIMCAFNKKYPEYEFCAHKGYPTKRHKALIRQYGPSPIHRRTFKGVKSE